MSNPSFNEMLANAYRKELQRAKELVQEAEKFVGDCPQKQMVFMLAIIAERLDNITVNLGA